MIKTNSLLTRIAIKPQKKQILCTAKRVISNLSYRHHVGREPLTPVTVGKLLEITASKYGDREAIVSKAQNKRLTFAEVLTEADKLAAGLQAVGLERGDRVGIWAPNLVEWYITMMACARGGFLLVGLNPAYEAPELEYSINKVQVKALVTPVKYKRQDFYNIADKLMPELKDAPPGKLQASKLPSLETVITIGEESVPGTFNYNEVLNFGDSTRIQRIKKEQNSILPDEPINIQFTSGTTGKPKAAIISHFQLVNNSYLIGVRNELNRSHHKICVQVPFFHAYGTVITISAALNHGSTMVLPGPLYNPYESLEAIKTEQCTIIHGTPTMYVDLVRVQKEKQEDINPEIALSGGAVCSPHLFKEMLSTLKVKKVKSVFGMSEVTAVIFQSLPDDDEHKSTATVGHISDHVEAKVVDENNNIVPLGTPGELCVRVYSSMLGYWGDEEKTREMMGSDRWLKTGDQFVLQEDGYGRIVGRIKDMIIRGGENIFPREIEDLLNTHPNILECHVVGLNHERLGEEVCACVRVEKGSLLNLQDVTEFCKGKMAHFKIPTQLRIVEEFPKTISGKIQKFILRRNFEQSEK